MPYHTQRNICLSSYGYHLPSYTNLGPSSPILPLLTNPDRKRGDETTVYLLADGRYMDRINAVYIYDGKETWTDESGVEWNKAVK